MRERIVLKIFGRVQGVFFRASVRAKAEELGLAGWVENMPDGSVKITAEGSGDKGTGGARSMPRQCRQRDGQLQKFISWCKIGTELARVERVEVEWVEAEGKFERFEIR